MKTGKEIYDMPNERQVDYIQSLDGDARKQAQSALYSYRWYVKKRQNKDKRTVQSKTNNKVQGIKRATVNFESLDDTNSIEEIAQERDSYERQKKIDFREPKVVYPQESKIPARVQYEEELDDPTPGELDEWEIEELETSPKEKPQELPKPDTSKAKTSSPSRRTIELKGITAYQEITTRVCMQISLEVLMIGERVVDLDKLVLDLEKEIQTTATILVEQNSVTLY